MAIQRDHWISLEEYHEIERKSGIKYEYSNGRIYDMSGDKSKHSRIAINMTIALELHLDGGDCYTFNSDMKVLPLGDENPTYYPDVVVTCNPDDYQDDSPAIRSPRLIIEVLSPSTASKDRGEKLRAYQACKSCQEYALVSTHHQEIVVHRRMSTGEWKTVQYTAEDDLQLVSVRLAIPVRKIYARTNIPPLASVLSTDQTEEIE
jgi:Uma2 family endonuclease